MECKEEKTMEDYRIKEDMICPITKEHCDDECCPIGAWCNLTSDEICDLDYKTERNDDNKN